MMKGSLLYNFTQSQETRFVDVLTIQALVQIKAMHARGLKSTQKVMLAR